MSERRASCKGWFGWLAAAGIFLGAALPTGCTTETVPGDDCVGGVVVDGRCEAKCDPAKCLEGNVCVDNRCKLLCDSHEDCFPGYQVCRDKQTDGDPPQNVKVCDDSLQTPVIDPATQFPFGWWGLECPFGDEQCALQTACPDGTPCTTASPCNCELDEAACGDDPKCNRGKCAEDGAACIFNRCAAAECLPLECVNFRSEGDAGAYCAKRGCTADADCAQGFYCGLERVPGPACGDDPDGFCGDDDTECVDLATPGAAYQQGTRCVMQGTCLKASQCNPCETNLDCSLGDADVCANHLGDNICARFCVDDSNCAADEACVPYAPSTAKERGSSATCALSPNYDCTDAAVDCPTPGDSCVPRNVCVPRSGKCDSSDVSSKFCAHCTNDLDCGPAGSSWICFADDNGDNVCIDTNFTTCSTDAECPVSPSGQNGRCIQASDPPVIPTGNCWFPLRNAPYDGFGCFPR